jgi:hypothetical protein
MITEYTKEDDMQTLRLWYDAKPFTKELENSIRALAQTVFSDDTIEDYIQERLKANNGNYDKPLPKEEPTLDELALNDDTKVEETKETIQQDTATQEVDETNEWNP